MKLIFSEYLASLKERGELDVIMPDLLSEIGFTVFSRPAVGTKQHGVDVAAVGPGPDGERTLFLISIKAGDLRRSGWDVGAQSLRTSLNQILDVYIENFIPRCYADLPVIIVLCLGGDLHEGVRTDVEGYMKRNTVDCRAAGRNNGLNQRADMTKMLVYLSLALLITTGCSTSPGLFLCDITAAVLDNVSCELDCHNKYRDRASNSDYAYQRCIYECREADNDDQCTKAVAEAEYKAKAEAEAGARAEAGAKPRTDAEAEAKAEESE